MSYQKIILVGNLGRDPEMRYTPNGTPVTNFSMAVNRRRTGPDGSQEDETTWFRITAWQKTAEIAAQYLSKGRQVMVEGRMNPDRATGGPRIWTRQDGTAAASYEVTADRIVFLGSRNDTMAAGPGAPAADNYVAEDDIPF